ncbi:hypothetical protein ACFFGT_27605 [Mucilaginibacter angelicae]|uniref:Uncharacterized protein n=1 Tax=Mucilaginibacter angelicae TaxID=869718 RepID=A0ABV6LEY9_9SPHI
MAEKHKTTHRNLQSDADGSLKEVDLSQGKPETDFWADVPEVVQQAIEKAKKQLDQGEGIPHDEVMKK